MLVPVKIPDGASPPTHTPFMGRGRINRASAGILVTPIAFSTSTIAQHGLPQPTFRLPEFFCAL